MSGDKFKNGLLTQLHAMHRSGYMGERMQYYKRQDPAMKYPDEYMSLIFDGMMQTHCQIPYLKNSYDFGSFLPQHLQGVLQDGQNFSCFRTFEQYKFEHLHYSA